MYKDPNYLIPNIVKLKSWSLFTMMNVNIWSVNLNWREKNPKRSILLSVNQGLTELIVVYARGKVYHSGVREMLSQNKIELIDSLTDLQVVKR